MAALRVVLRRLGGTAASSTPSNILLPSVIAPSLSPFHFCQRWATSQANELRVGTVVVKGDALLEVVKWSYTQGQARASGNVQVEYRNLRTGSKTGERLSPSDKVERAVLDSEEYQYLYSEGGDTAVLMHPTTFDQREVPLASFGPHASHFLTEGCTVSMLFYNGEEISAALPDEVEMEAAPAMKGESVNNQYKPAVLDSGFECKVPGFVEAGDKVVVNTKTGDFVRRVR